MIFAQTIMQFQNLLKAVQYPTCLSKFLIHELRCKCYWHYIICHHWNLKKIKALLIIHNICVIIYFEVQNVSRLLPDSGRLRSMRNVCVLLCHEEICDRTFEIICLKLYTFAILRWKITRQRTSQEFWNIRITENKC